MLNPNFNKPWSQRSLKNQTTPKFLIIQILHECKYRDGERPEEGGEEKLRKWFRRTGWKPVAEPGAIAEMKSGRALSSARIRVEYEAAAAADRMRFWLIEDDRAAMHGALRPTKRRRITLTPPIPSFSKSSQTKFAQGFWRGFWIWWIGIRSESRFCLTCSWIHPQQKRKF